MWSYCFSQRLRYLLRQPFLHWQHMHPRTDTRSISRLISRSVARGWRRGVVVRGVRRMNEVNARPARLVLGWVTVFGRVYHIGV